MKPQAQIEYKPLSELKELPGNPRTIKKDQFEKLKKSLQDNAHYFRDIRTETTVFDDKRPIEELSNKELKELVANYRAAIPTSIIRENKPSKSEDHPTMKPVKLIARLIGNSTREGELVMDLFGGSGTTMIAAEQLNRRCYMMELDPHYADVIIERWQNLTGQKAERIK